jgi:hypothetical protein
MTWIRGDKFGLRGRDAVYFDGDCEAVAAATDPMTPPGRGYLQARDLPQYPKSTDLPHRLPLWTTYCWRIDENNDDGTITKGRLWTFTTGCEDIPGDTNKDCLVNGDDYADVAGTWLLEQLWP